MCFKNEKEYVYLILDLLFYKITAKGGGGMGILGAQCCDYMVNPLLQSLFNVSSKAADHPSYLQRLPWNSMSIIGHKLAMCCFKRQPVNLIK